MFTYGQKATGFGLSVGAEEALGSMKAGGKRRVTLPASRGFGAQGVTLRPTRHVGEKDGTVGPNEDLEYVLEVVRVSIPPS